MAVPETRRRELPAPSPAVKAERPTVLGRIETVLRTDAKGLILPQDGPIGGRDGDRR